MLLLRKQIAKENRLILPTWFLAAVTNANKIIKERWAGITIIMRSQGSDCMP